MVKAEIAVVGMGYVGMTAVLDLSQRGHCVTRVGTVDPQAGARDTRSTALFPESVDLLKRLDVWADLEGDARPLLGIRIVDATKTVLRAPEVTFRAAECGLDALAMNVPNRVLHQVLAARVRDVVPEKHCLNGQLESATLRDGGIRMSLSDGTTHVSPYCVAADGRHSRMRDTAGIGLRAWAYDQVALACSITHSANHEDISTEFHRSAGPLTTVPGAPVDGLQTSHIVWIETPAVAQRLMDLSESAFRAELERSLHGLLGTVHFTSPRGAFAIKGQTARSFAGNGVFLIGETAHVLPPIGAQGMNLGFRDVRGLGETLATTSDVNAMERAYNDDRRNDVFLRTTAVDLLNRSLTTPYWPAQALRGAGLHMLNMLPPLKRAVIQAGFGN